MHEMNQLAQMYLEENIFNKGKIFLGDKHKFMLHCYATKTFV
jgi:hypothetical protein